jgi:hypothetical protein
VKPKKMIRKNKVKVRRSPEDYYQRRVKKREFPMFVFGKDIIL